MNKPSLSAKPTAKNISDLAFADLGFIAPVSDISRGGSTRVLSLDEGGVLPLGSKGYRSPEQIDATEEIAFTVVNDGDEDGLSNALELFGSFDSDVQEGDWLYLSGEFNVDEKKQEKKQIAPELQK